MQYALFHPYEQVRKRFVGVDAHIDPTAQRPGRLRADFISARRAVAISLDLRRT